jgi:hypothetical protein
LLKICFSEFPKCKCDVENRMLRRIFGPKGGEVTEEWRNVHSEELHNLYSSQDIIRQIKSRRMM